MELNKNNKVDPKFKVVDRARISKCKNILAKVQTRNWSEEDFAIKKVKNIKGWTYVVEDLNGEKMFGALYEKELQKTNQIELRVKKVNGETTIILLTVGFIKKIELKKIQLYKINYLL